MIKLICAGTGTSREDAYTLCSLAADLRVTQMVNGAKGIHESEWSPISAALGPIACLVVTFQLEIHDGRT